MLAKTRQFQYKIIKYFSFLQIWPVIKACGFIENLNFQSVVTLWLTL